MDAKPAKKKCAILGATGAVGTRFVQLLENHPSLELVAVGASAKSEGKQYASVVHWLHATPIPPKIADMIVRPCTPSHYSDCEVIFSGLDSSVAGEIEMAFLQAEFAVFSNAGNHRMDPLVPLVVPTVNISHLQMIPAQRQHYELQKGFLVCNSNCAVVGIVVAFAALQKLGSIDQASAVSMQAISGSGYPGVPSLDILDNVIPYIPGEEDKIQAEAGKILGNFQKDPEASIVHQTVPISVACNRVPVLDGHLLCVSLRYTSRPPPSLDQVQAALKGYVSDVQGLDCSSAPKRSIVVYDEPNRPQPRLDRNTEAGFTVNVGRVRCDPSGVFDYMFVVLSHNTIIGAAGASIMNAEAAIAQGYV
ncbi:aspartate-semialdehyde dehydrogenase [Aaosphaeria arxii CBS 175.79]|uniref:Aspartate-semialdehyde dehydrogenase n=1 Tax=Aaosphaeria arxii CBS 175.79 TaxID=1450172 RepID=A0A6A5XCM1_9PLEO|nr:aspartate-semialdehyde dehydrogenase [Aaosphaeria arxii CBS 175.79]KAF2010855.1 aspartate-semialdehyde dehydrogenase [Aaosphaeria arxii CBS 175.79]